MRKWGRRVCQTGLLMGVAMDCIALRVLADVGYFQCILWRKVCKSGNDVFTTYKAVLEVLVGRVRWCIKRKARLL